MAGHAVRLGIVNCGLKTPSWAPATGLNPTSLSNGWQFNPVCLDAMPQPLTGGVFRTNSFNDQTLQRVEQVLFDRVNGALIETLHPGTTSGTATSIGVNWAVGRLMFTGSGLANYLYTSAQNDGLPPLNVSFINVAQIQLANGLIFAGQPITYKDDIGNQTMGQLWGVTGLDQFNIQNPFETTTKIAIDTTLTGGGNPPFFAVGASFCNTFNLFDDDDYVNRLFVGPNPNNNGPWIFFWQDGALLDQTIIQPTMDDAHLQTYLDAGTAIINAWGGGFVVGFPTAGSGPTGLPMEWALFDLNWTQYLLLNWVPEDAQAALELGHAGGINTVTLDSNGTIWAASESFPLYPLVGGQVTPSSIPANVLTGIPIDLPCFNPCVSNP